MKKIPTYFERDWEGDRSRVLDKVTPGCEWVAEGAGTATVKYDGTAVLVADGHVFKRYEVKKGKTPPPDFTPAQEADPETGKQAGWVPRTDAPEDKWLREVLSDGIPPDGTYELAGPKVQGNPHEFGMHCLIRHGEDHIDPDPGRTFEALTGFLAAELIEGIVWHHPDGRMAKIKRRDFGHAWPPRKEKAPSHSVT